jgi:hypothetical protein
VFKPRLSCDIKRDGKSVFFAGARALNTLVPIWQSIAAPFPPNMPVAMSVSPVQVCGWHDRSSKSFVSQRILDRNATMRCQVSNQARLLYASRCVTSSTGLRVVGP